MSTVPRRLWREALLAGLAAAAAVGVLLLPPLAQDPAYHQFSDRRTLWGVPHFWNVITNLPFVAVGVAGVWLLWRDGGLGPGRLFQKPGEKAPFLVAFVGIALTGPGSAWYHLAPSNETLVWDRLPITVAFMGMFAGILGERVGPRLGVLLLGPLVLAGAGSVLAWYVGELEGRGNLRPYLLVQFYPLAAIPLVLLLFPARYSRGGDYLVAGAWYVLAKVLEQTDAGWHKLLGAVGGHPLKHLAAALGAFWVLRMLYLRRPLGEAAKLQRPAGVSIERRNQIDPTR